MNRTNETYWFSYLFIHFINDGEQREKKNIMPQNVQVFASGRIKRQQLYIKLEQSNGKKTDVEKLQLNIKHPIGCPIDGL